MTRIQFLLAMVKGVNFIQLYGMMTLEMEVLLGVSGFMVNIYDMSVHGSSLKLCSIV